jgi:hypothetical protein
MTLQHEVEIVSMHTYALKTMLEGKGCLPVGFICIFGMGGGQRLCTSRNTVGGFLADLPVNNVASSYGESNVQNGFIALTSNRPWLSCLATKQSD